METFSSLSLLPSSPAFHSSKTSSLIFSHGFLPSLLGRHSRPAATVTPPLPRARGGGMVMASSAVSRRTLSEGWDLSAPVSGSAWMPRFDELDTTNMLLKQRIVFLGSQVDDMTADLIVNQLLFLDAEDEKKDIKLFINSPGGSVTVDDVTADLIVSQLLILDAEDENMDIKLFINSPGGSVTTCISMFLKFLNFFLLKLYDY